MKKPDSAVYQYWEHQVELFNQDMEAQVKTTCAKYNITPEELNLIFNTYRKALWERGLT